MLTDLVQVSGDEGIELLKSSFPNGKEAWVVKIWEPDHESNCNLIVCSQNVAQTIFNLLSAHCKGVMIPQCIHESVEELLDNY